MKRIHKTFALTIKHIALPRLTRKSNVKGMNKSESTYIAGINYVFHSSDGGNLRRGFTSQTPKILQGFVYIRITKNGTSLVHFSFELLQRWRSIIIQNTVLSPITNVECVKCKTTNDFIMKNDWRSTSNILTVVAYIILLCTSCESR